MTYEKIFAEPEWLGRNDANHGAWVVEECEARRGIPMTSITERMMRAPVKSDELSRVIRAHEMMHAKVSPAEDFPKWIDRKFATQESLIAVEELRVNYLCKKAGFNVEEHLADGGETADGERVVATNDWKGAVFMAIATAGTASNKQFLNGVRRHNRLWGKVLLDISKRALKEISKVNPRHLASTAVDKATGLSPLGFSHTERLAEWVDRLAGMDPPQEEEVEEVEESKEDESTTDDDKGDEKVAKREHSNKGVKGVKVNKSVSRLKTITPDRGHHSLPTWGNLVVEYMPMPKLSNGNLGKKRTASNMGRSPRRIHRYATDPQKRIFDKVTRGMGGVVIIDGSGSMSLNEQELRNIVEASPGCTVAVYSDMDNCRGATNMWVVANKGRMVNELPKVGQGNGVDFPAIEWGVKHRQRGRSPVVWVTDGGVCGANASFSDLLAMQCIEYCKKNRIIVVEHVEEAVKALSNLKRNGRARRTWNYMFKNTYRKRMGAPLVEDEVS